MAEIKTKPKMRNVAAKELQYSERKPHSLSSWFSRESSILSELEFGDVGFSGVWVVTQRQRFKQLMWSTREATCGEWNYLEYN